MSEPAQQSLDRNVASASMFMISLRVCFRVIGVFSSLLLIHLLLPSDFGLVGLATAVASALETLTETSFSLALLRLPDMSRPHLDTAWTMQIMRGLLVGSILIGTAGLAADWMQDPRVGPIMWVLGATSIATSFENVGMVEFRRNLKFRKIFEARIYAKFLGLLAMLPAAAMFHSYWALIAGIVTMRVFVTAFSYYQHPYRPRLSMACWRELFHFSKWFLISNLLWMIESFAPTMLFGRIAGAYGVGLYQIAFQFASLPASEIAAPIREPIYAGYTRLLDQTDKLRKQFVDGFAILMLVIAPMSVGIALTGDLITPVAFGPEWTAASALIAPCALYTLIDAIAHFPHNVFIALNRQRDFVLTLAAMLAIRFPLFVWVGIEWGMVPAIYVLVATAGPSAVVWMRSAMPMLNLGIRELLAPVWRTAVSVLVMTVVLLAFANLRAGTDPYGVVLVRLLWVAGFGAALQIGTQGLLWMASGCPDGPETKLFDIARDTMRKLSAFRLRGRRAPAG